MSAYIAIGSNLPQGRVSARQIVCDAAASLLHAYGGGEMSGLWLTPAWPSGDEKPDYINAVCQVERPSAPELLMDELLQMEQKAGRVRGKRWESRTLDLDILDYDGHIRLPDQHHNLELPHPRATERAFVMLPLWQLSPHWRHPVTGTHIEQLVSQLPLSATQYVKYLGFC